MRSISSEAGRSLISVDASSAAAAAFKSLERLRLTSAESGRSELGLGRGSDEGEASDRFEIDSGEPIGDEWLLGSNEGEAGSIRSCGEVGREVGGAIAWRFGEAGESVSEIADNLLSEGEVISGR